MIKDRLENIYRYSINEHFENFKNFINECVGENLTEVSLPLKAIPLEYSTGEFNLCKFENHQQFIDIHYILDGEEKIGLNSIAELTPNMVYDAANDYQLFDGVIRESLNLAQGEFLILFPGEAHVTAGSINKDSKIVKKIVYKVPLI